MKHVLMLAAALLAAHAIVAQDAKQPAAAQAPAAATGTVLDAAPLTATTTDSPLVAASKRANRKGKKATNVITNETLKKPSKAHVTTTASQKPLPPAPSTVTLKSEDQLREERMLKEQATRIEAEHAAKKQQEVEAAQRRLAIAAAAAESEYGDGAAEREADEAAKAAKAKEEKKPPQR